MDPRVLMVDRLRLWVTVLLRVAAVVWAAFAFMAVVRVITSLLAAASLSSNNSRIDFLEAFQSPGISLTLTMLGHLAAVAALVFYSRKLACWIVPAARGCPACGYNIGGIKSSRCPECGQIIAFMQPAGESKTE